MPPELLIAIDDTDREIRKQRRGVREITEQVHWF
jgi:hypothetical protein